MTGQRNAWTRWTVESKKRKAMELKEKIAEAKLELAKALRKLDRELEKVTKELKRVDRKNGKPRNANRPKLGHYPLSVSLAFFLQKVSRCTHWSQ